MRQNLVEFFVLVLAAFIGRNQGVYLLLQGGVVGAGLVGQGMDGHVDLVDFARRLQQAAVERPQRRLS